MSIRTVFPRSVVPHFVFCCLCSAAVLAQEASAGSPSATVREFPVLLESNVVAGKTPPGSKIQAKLSVATLVDGTVIPRNAVFIGEVTQSVAKTASDPSRLAIRMDSAQWKNGSASIKAFLTVWYYPTVDESSAQNVQYGPTQPANRTWNGQGQYPDPNSKVYKPFPSDSDQSAAVPTASSSVTSNRRIPMKGVESEQANDGTITIVSKKANIKLDKLTTYVLATGDLEPPPVRPAAAK